MSVDDIIGIGSVDEIAGGEAPWQWDPDGETWILRVGQLGTVRAWTTPDPLRERLARALLRVGGGRGTPRTAPERDVQRALGWPDGRWQRTLDPLVGEGWIERIAGGELILRPPETVEDHLRWSRGQVAWVATWDGVLVEHGGGGYLADAADDGIEAIVTRPPPGPAPAPYPETWRTSAWDCGRRVPRAPGAE